MPVICRRCQTINSASSVYCSKCGAPLIRRPPAAKKGIYRYLPFAGALVLLIGFYFLYAALSKTKHTKTTGVQSESGQPSAAPVLPGKGTAPFVVGDIVVQDFRGREVSRSAAPLIGGGWVACPIWALFGGESIFFQTSGSNPVRIERGFWSVGDPVALWQTEAGKELAAYRLIRWKQSSSVEWHSLRLSSPPLQVEIVSPSPRGSLMSFPLPRTSQGSRCLYPRRPDRGLDIRSSRRIADIYGPAPRKGA